MFRVVQYGLEAIKYEIFSVSIYIVKRAVSRIFMTPIVDLDQKIQHYSKLFFD